MGSLGVAVVSLPLEPEQFPQIAEASQVMLWCFCSPVFVNLSHPLNIFLSTGYFFESHHDGRVLR